jgi:hypothetical protein
MLRRVAAVLALVLVVACVSAKEYKGTITKLDIDKKTVTVKVDGEEKTFVYSDKSEFLKGNGKSIPQEALSKLAERIGDKGIPGTVETDEKDGKEVSDKDGKVVIKSLKLMGKKQKSE